MVDNPSDKSAVATVMPPETLVDAKFLRALFPAAIQDPEKRPACFKSTIQECLFILTATMSIGTSSFLHGICTINPASALTSGSFLLFFAMVADTFGRRPLLIFSAGNPVGAVFGSIFSGIAARLFSWRTSFYLLAMIYLVFFLAAIWTVPKTQKDTERLTWDTLRRFDFFGILISMAGISLFCSSLSIAGDAPEGWRTPYVIAMLILGIACIVGFIAWESYCKNPMMPLHIWKDRNFSLIDIIVLFGFMSFVTDSFWISLYMQNVLNYSPLEVAVRLLPQAICGIIVNVIAGLILHRVNNKLLTGIGAVSYFLAALLLAVMKEHNTYWAYMFPSLILAVIRADFQFNVANMYVMSSLPPAQQSLAGGIFNTVSKICGTVGLGISASVYNAESTSAQALQTSTTPYTAAFWFTTAASGVGILFVPFLTIGTQGHSDKESSGESSGKETPDNVVSAEEIRSSNNNGKLD